MLFFSVFKESFISKSVRRLKINLFGRTKTPIEIAPFGDDSNPVPNMIALYAKTSEHGDHAVIGYINQNRVSKVGEKRIYATDTEGNQISQIYLKTDGSITLNNGSSSAVKFEELQSAINAQNTLINAELAEIAATFTTLGGAYVPGSISTNLSAAASEIVKLD